MPDMAVTLLVILCFLACALCLRVLAAEPTEGRLRAVRVPRRTARAMMDE